MKSILPVALAGLLLCNPGSGIAAQLQCSGVLGNSGEQGATLVRFGSTPARGIGVVYDDTGALWDRGCDGVLNRYALDGRLLATYNIPPGHAETDRLTRVGTQLLLLLSGKLYNLPIDAPPNATATALGVSADVMSYGSANGSVAVGTNALHNGWKVSLFNPESKQMTPLADGTFSGLHQIELMPNQDLVADISGKLHLFQNDEEVTNGWPRTGPMGTIQFINGFWYGSMGHGTVRRFNADLEPEPGVVAGGASGSFIGHVDGNEELCRSVTALHGNLFAASGINGVIHLLQWDEDRQKFTIVRRIGAVPLCGGLGINSQGQIWYNWGVWNWNDGPADVLHNCAPGGPSADEPVLGQVALLPNDDFVAPMIRNGHPNVMGGPFSWNVSVSDLLTGGSGYFAGSAVYTADRKHVLVAINPAGHGESYQIDASGKIIAEAGFVTLEPASPVNQWTSLAMKNEETLLGAADGFIIEMARDGANWKETRRWNSWQGPAPASFGPEIYIAADSGRLWVSDTRHSRVLCFDASQTPTAAFGVADAQGSDLSHLDQPRSLAARQMRAIVFDSGNQRLVKLTLTQ